MGVFSVADFETLAGGAAWQGFEYKSPFVPFRPFQAFNIQAALSLPLAVSDPNDDLAANIFINSNLVGEIFDAAGISPWVDHVIPPNFSLISYAFDAALLKDSSMNELKIEVSGTGILLVGATVCHFQRQL